MSQELIDHLLGELGKDEAAALEARLRDDERLAREYRELGALFALMRRGEQVEPSPAMRTALVAEARRRAVPSLWARLGQVPALIRYRLEHSWGFRVAAASIAAHLLVMLGLFVTLGKSPKPQDHPVSLTVLPAEGEPQRPDRAFQVRLLHRRAPHGPRLKAYGVEGQAEAIETGLETLLARQAPDGSFGDAAETAWATLALLAEGDSSAQCTRRGRAIRAATERLIDSAKAGASHGAILAALVENYALAFEDLPAEARLEYSGVIRGLVRTVGEDEISREARALASLAGFHVPVRNLGAAGVLVRDQDRSKLLDAPASRLAATIVLAKGHGLSPDRDRVRAWSRALFERATDEVGAGKVSGLVVLTLQAPYRL